MPDERVNIKIATKERGAPRIPHLRIGLASLAINAATYAAIVFPALYLTDAHGGPALAITIAAALLSIVVGAKWGRRQAAKYRAARDQWYAAEDLRLRDDRAALEDRIAHLRILSDRPQG